MCIWLEGKNRCKKVDRYNIQCVFLNGSANIDQNIKINKHGDKEI